MLELIFQGFFEWIYGLILEAWEFFSDKLIDLMSMDFAYLQTHIPILPTIRQSMLAVGWALLIGNLVFQALRSMMAGIGFEAEDPKLLFSRTFVFSFLVLASPQICDICLDMTSTVIEIMKLPDAVDVDIIQESAFDGLACAWLLVFICGIIVMFQSFKLIFEMAERYFILAILTICAPLAFGMGGSRNTSDIFTGWCRMYGSMCLLTVLNVVFAKMLFSVLSTVPTGLSVLPWMVLILTIVKVAKKADAIVARIGLNPAITGDSLGRTFPGVLTYMVTRTAMSHATKALGKNLGKEEGGRSPSGGGPGTGGSPGGMGGSYTGPSWTGGKSGIGAWSGKKKPIIVSAEDWEPTQGKETSQAAAAHTTEAHMPEKEQRAETSIKSPVQPDQSNSGKSGTAQTRKSSVPRGTAKGSQRTVFTRQSVTSTASNGKRRETAAPAQPAVGQASAKSGAPSGRTAGTETVGSTRISNVSVEKGRPLPQTAIQRETANTSKKNSPVSGTGSEKTTQRTDNTRFTQRTVTERRAGSTAKLDMAGTAAAAPTRQTTRPERQGRNTPPMPTPPAAGKTSVSARQENPPGQKAQSMEKTKNGAIRCGTAGTGVALSTRQSAREERHSRDTSEQQQSVISTTGVASAAPAQQERAPVPKAAVAESGRTPPNSSGTAGTNAAQTTRLTLREERHSRNAPVSSPKSAKSEKTPGTARQESQSRPMMQPQNNGTGNTTRPGIAGTAPTGKELRQTRRTAQKPSSVQVSAQQPRSDAGEKADKPVGNKHTLGATRKSAAKKDREKNGKQ